MLSDNLKEFQITAIQEHWLYNYDQKNMEDFCELHGFTASLKSMDDVDPSLPSCRSRGKGGVGFLWSKELNSAVEVAKDRSERLFVLLLNA